MMSKDVSFERVTWERHIVTNDGVKIIERVSYRDKKIQDVKEAIIHKVKQRAA